MSDSDEDTYMNLLNSGIVSFHCTNHPRILSPVIPTLILISYGLDATVSDLAIDPSRVMAILQQLLRDSTHNLYSVMSTM